MFRLYDKTCNKTFDKECKTIQDAITELEIELSRLAPNSIERYIKEQGNDLGYCIANVSLIPILITDNMKVMIKQ